MKQITDITSDAAADAAGVRRFTKAMEAKLAKKRANGYGGWNRQPSHYYTGCTIGHLRRLFKKHQTKGDMVDVANLAMMIWNRENPTGEIAKL